MTAPALCPFTIDSPIMLQRWERLTFLHCSFDPAHVQALLPPTLQVDPLEGRAWVGLAPFFMRVGARGGQRVSWVSNFCETNVRTYVVDQEGRRGIWFFSLDAARLSAVVTARTTYRLPYFWSAMRLVERPGHHPLRLPAALAGAAGDEPGGDPDRRAVRLRGAERAGSLPHRPVDPVQRRRAPGALRTGRPRCMAAPPGHSRGGGRRLGDSGGAAPAGGEPLVHYSPGVEVRIGRPERYGRVIEPAGWMA